ncbi:hypothetical protein RS666_09665 [Phocaeicola dorei]|jgi:hypothetical protein|nr:hypothetical protein [Phocaeicola dorei]MDV7062065.1 hypothetical protein [Phocaeicola dorei]
MGKFCFENRELRFPEKKEIYGLVIAGWKDNSLPRKYSSFADLSG